jgi:hypothetical protein
VIWAPAWFGENSVTGFRHESGSASAIRGRTSRVAKHQSGTGPSAYGLLLLRLLLLLQAVTRSVSRGRRYPSRKSSLGVAT